MLRHEIAMLAERWGWTPEKIIAMPVRERRAYCYRVMEIAERERAANRR